MTPLCPLFSELALPLFVLPVLDFGLISGTANGVPQAEQNMLPGSECRKQFEHTSPASVDFTPRPITAWFAWVRGSVGAEEVISVCEALIRGFKGAPDAEKVWEPIVEKAATEEKVAEARAANAAEPVPAEEEAAFTKASETGFGAGRAL
jgi:hypothetical protein